MLFSCALLLAHLMGQYCFAVWRLSSSVMLRAVGPVGGIDSWRAGSRACGWSGGRHCTAGQSCYVPL